MVEVFKTNIKEKKIASALARNIQNRFPNYKINFDLQDCDKILRIVSEKIDHEGLIYIAGKMGCTIQLLS